jgi:hypothetical protein
LARARLLKPGFFKNEDLLDLPFEARLLFAGLWTLADREGRLEDRPKRIKMDLFPVDGVDVDGLLTQLAGAGFIQRYEVQGLRYVQVVSFRKHQHPHVREPASTIPAPGQTWASPGLALDEHQSGPAETETVTGNRYTEAETETETETETVERAPEHPFAYTFARKYQERHAGRPPPPTEHAAALALEREYGADACLEVAGDFDWQKHPNYLRPILQERREGGTTNGHEAHKRAPGKLDATERARLRLAGG